MPAAWQENFVHADMCITSVTLAQMTYYLASEQVITDARREKNNKGCGSQGGHSSSSISRGIAPGQGHGYQGRGCGQYVNKHRGSWTSSNNSQNEAKNDPCSYQGNAHTWLKCYGNPDGPSTYHPGFTPRPHGATAGHGHSGFRGSRGNGGDRNDAYHNDPASNAGSNNHASPSAASTVANAGSRSSGWVDRANVSGWGSSKQSPSNAAKG
eukprot:scaffold38967_cov54-Attheya_sp.AAC.5